MFLYFKATATKQNNSLEQWFKNQIHPHDPKAVAVYNSNLAESLVTTRGHHKQLKLVQVS